MPVDPYLLLKNDMVSQSWKPWLFSFEMHLLYCPKYGSSSTSVDSLINTSVAVSHFHVMILIDNDHRRRCAVPKHLCTNLLEKNHSGPIAGYFSGEKLHGALVRHWWWPGMFTDVTKHCLAFPLCVIVSGSSRVKKLESLHFTLFRYRSHSK